MKETNKVSESLKKALEYLWLIMAIISLGIASREVYLHGLKEALPFIAFMVIALFFYLTRRFQRMNKKDND